MTVWLRVRWWVGGGEGLIEGFFVVIFYERTKVRSGQQLQFVAFAGQQFKIRLGSNDGSEGTGQLLVDCESFGTPCPADLDNDGFVGGGDLGVLLSQFGSSGSADLDGSGTVDGGDIGLMLSVWGQCQG